MKNVWILDHHASEPAYNGISRHFDFAKSLSKAGINVTVISSSYSHFNHEYFIQDEFFVSNIESNARFVYLKSKPAYFCNGKKRFLNMISYMIKAEKSHNKIARLYGNPDAVIGCSIHPLAWVAAYKISKHYDCSFNIEVRDFWPLFFIESNQYSKRHPVVWFFSGLEKWAYKRADNIIVSLPFAEKYISNQLGFPKEKITWIGQPMDCDQFDVNANNNELLIPDSIKKFIDNSLVCVFSGYYKEYEGVFTMLEAAKILQDRGVDIKMLFVGNGSSEEKMKEYVSSCNLGNVLIGPRIPKNAMPALLKMCNIKLAALSTENPNAFSYGISKNKINEYLYSGGCTIFGFLQPGSAVEASGGGYVISPNDSELLADTIIKASSLPELDSINMTNSARQYIRSIHHVDVLTKKLLDILFENDISECK